MSERIATRYAYGEELAEAGSDSRKGIRKDFLTWG